VVKAECRECKYRGMLEYPEMAYCNYSLTTGHTKLGLPKRKDGLCPAFDNGEKKQGERFASREVTALRKRRKTKYPHDQMRQLWEQGLFDREIAEQIGCGERAVSMWRRREGLPSQRERTKRR